MFATYTYVQLLVRLYHFQLFPGASMLCFRCTGSIPFPCNKIHVLWFHSYRTNEVTLINFALGKHLVREDDLLSDQRGSLAYVSPDVLSGK